MNILFTSSGRRVDLLKLAKKTLEKFGGGAPMSIMAGANSIENLIRLKAGEKLRYNENWRSDIAFSRFDDSVIVDG